MSAEKLRILKDIKSRFDRKIFEPNDIETLELLQFGLELEIPDPTHYTLLNKFVNTLTETYNVGVKAYPPKENPQPIVKNQNNLDKKPKKLINNIREVSIQELKFPEEDVPPIVEEEVPAKLIDPYELQKELLNDYIPSAKRLYKEYYSPDVRLDFIYCHYEKFGDLEEEVIIDSIITGGFEFEDEPQSFNDEECKICNEEGRFFYILECTHSYCFQCLRELTRVALDENKAPECPLCKVKLALEDVFYISPAHIYETYKQIELKFAIRNIPGATRCPNKKCESEFIIDQRENLPEYTCFECSHSFCPKCQLLPHYGETCDSAKKIDADWVHWLHDNNRDHLKLKDAFDKLVADELYKEKNCKHCPKCGKISQRTEGCTLMVCGRAYHGGDKQDGCGHKYDWNLAVSYKADVTHFQKEKYKNIQGNHRIDCSACSKNIVGLRFKCINCVYFNLCAVCEASKNNHNKDHRFKIVTVAENLPDALYGGDEAYYIYDDEEPNPFARLIDNSDEDVPYQAFDDYSSEEQFEDNVNYDSSDSEDEEDDY